MQMINVLVKTKHKIILFVLKLDRWSLHNVDTCSTQATYTISVLNSKF